MMMMVGTGVFEMKFRVHFGPPLGNFVPLVLLTVKFSYEAQSRTRPLCATVGGRTVGPTWALAQFSNSGDP